MVFKPTKCYREHVMGQGNVEGSNLGQRLAELILHIFRSILDETELPASALERETKQWLRQWFDDRSSLQDGSGRRQTDLHIESVFTDDTQYRLLGVAGKIRADRAWHLTTKRVNVIMAQASKRQHGTHHTSSELASSSRSGSRTSRRTNWDVAWSAWTCFARARSRSSITARYCRTAGACSVSCQHGQSGDVGHVKTT